MRREEREGVRCSGRRRDVDLRIFSLTFFGTASAFQPYGKPPTAETNLRRDTVVDAEKTDDIVKISGLSQPPISGTWSFNARPKPRPSICETKATPRQPTVGNEWQLTAAFTKPNAS